MKLLSKVFGIHPLTEVDIQSEEEGEDVELLRTYRKVALTSDIVRISTHFIVSRATSFSLDTVPLSGTQDHLITMTQNSNHYEKILSHTHSNYLAQVSIEVTDVNNQINEVLSKLTALGTILVPMSLVTGLWGMDVPVPRQDITGFAWFSSVVGVLGSSASRSLVDTFLSSFSFPSRL